jgi:hypothetical protein
MAIDAETKAFLDLTDGDIAAWTRDRADALGLTLPEATLPAVHENLALLRTQTALFIAALGDQPGEPQVAAFEP